MHWVTFVILMYLAAVLQTTLAPAVAIHDVRPDFMVILAVFYALYARTYDALLICWIIGLVIDLASLGYEGRANVGLHAASLGVIGWGMVKLRVLTVRDSVVTQIFFSLAAAALLAIAAGAYMMHAAKAWDLFSEVIWRALFTAIYTAAVTPYVHWALRRLRGPLGIGTGSVFKTL